MKKLNKVLLSGGMIGLMMSSSLFASPLADATAGVFASEGDNYLDVIEFNSVQFDKLFTNLNISSDKLDLGAAFCIKDLYFGAAYTGDFISKTINKDTTVTTTQTEGTDLFAGTVGSTEIATLIKKSSNLKSCNNSFQIFTGFKDFGGGIKLSMGWNGTTSSNNGSGDYSVSENNSVNPQTDRTFTNNSSRKLIYIDSLEAGMPLDLGPVELKLKGGILVGFNYDDSLSESNTYTMYNGSKGALVSSSSTKSDKGFVTIVPTFEASAFDATIGYTGELFLYNKKIDGIAAKLYTQSKNHSVTVGENGITVSTDTNNLSYDTDRDIASNKLYLLYNKTVDLNDKLSVGILGRSDFDFGTVKYGDENNIKNVSTTTYDYSNAVSSAVPAVYLTKETKTTVSAPASLTRHDYFAITPTLGLAATYKANQTVKFNFGFQATANAFTTAKTTVTKSANYPFEKITTVETYSDGSVKTYENVQTKTSDTRTETSSDQTAFDKINTSASFGTTFQFTDNMALDMCYKAVTKNGLNDITKIFSNLTIAATVKF